MAKKSRREIADLLQKGRVETARLRVEGLIQDDIYVELLELLEVGLTNLPSAIVMMRGTYEHCSSRLRCVVADDAAVLGDAPGEVQPSGRFNVSLHVADEPKRPSLTVDTG